ncbi:hypothetical protein D3C76_1719040 [compost metagenome]
MKGIAAGIRRHEVGQHVAEQLHLAPAFQTVRVDVQGGAHAAHGQALDQPVIGLAVDFLDGAQALGGPAGLWQVVGADEVIHPQD